MTAKSTLFTLALSLLFSANLWATKADKPTDAPTTDIKTEIKEFISHHLQDTHDFHLTEGLSFPLPVLLWDNGLQFSSSAKFHHGEAVAEHNGMFYRLYHGKIYKTDVGGTISYDENQHAVNEKPLDFSITKNVSFILLVSLLMMWMFKRMANSYKQNPLPTGIGRFRTNYCLCQR